MTKGSVSLTVSNMMKQLKDETLTWDQSIQRGANAWSKEQKSSLIHSMLADMYIPSLCFLKETVRNEEAGKDDIVYSVLDGKQRLSVVFSFVNDEYKLDKKTPTVEIEGTTYEIAGKKFSGLEKDLQDIIKKYKFSISTLEGCTEKEIELAFFRLNNGTPLTNVQKSRAILGDKNAAIVNNLLTKDFFNNCNFTKLQRSKEDDLTVLLQGMMLADNRYDSWGNIGAKEISVYCEYLRDNFTEDFEKKITDTVDYLSEAFDKDLIESLYNEELAVVLKFTKRINLPIIFKVAADNMAKVPSTEYIQFLVQFLGNEDEYFAEELEAYKKACGNGTVSKEKVNARIKALSAALAKRAAK